VLKLECSSHILKDLSLILPVSSPKPTRHLVGVDLYDNKGLRYIFASKKGLSGTPRALDKILPCASIAPGWSDGTVSRLRARKDTPVVGAL